MNCTYTQCACFANSIHPFQHQLKFQQMPQFTGTIRLAALAHSSKGFKVSNSSTEDETGNDVSTSVAKGSGTTARGRRLLKIREEKRKREFENLNTYPAWAKVLEDACRNDSELRAVLGDSIGNPDVMRKKVEERVRQKGRNFQKSKSGSVLAFKVSFRDFNPLDSYIWFELYGSPSDRDVDLLGSIIQSWYVIGRLGAFNAANLQLANSSMEYNPLYDEDKGFKVMTSSFHDISDVEFQDNWGRVWILHHMNKKGLVPSSKAYTGVIEAYGLGALYEEALVAFNTMNEVGSIPTIETFNSLIHTFAKGGLYKENEAILLRMGDLGVPKNRESLNGVIEGYRQGGQFEEAIKAYVDMEKVRCDPDEYTLEAVLSVYCFAGLVDESEQQFKEIKELGIQPSVICYCMMLAVYGRAERWDKVNELLNEMHTNRVSNIHQVMGQMIKGDFDDDSNWQMVEYVFDKLKSEGSGLGIRLYNTVLEALWCLGQKERAAKVLQEATKRGMYPELYRTNKIVWSVDVHRMWPGGACTALSLVNNMQELLIDGEDLPQLATVVVVRGQMERSSITRDFPVAKAAYSLLKEVSSSFCFPGWNNGRIICQKSHLKRLFSSEDSKLDDIVNLRNSPFPVSGPKTCP